MADRIGIYGGTFDPVHTGHLLLGRDAVEQLNLSRLIFVPAAISPHKLEQEPGASGLMRLRMLTEAVAGEENFVVDAGELDRPGPSFTIDTLETLRSRLAADCEFFYLVGEDNLAKLHTWHRIDDLRRLATFVVFRRGGAAEATAPAHGFPTLERRVDVSSTEIRKRVAAGRSIRYFVPECVEAIIDAHNLYRPPTTTTQTGPALSPPKK